MERNDLIAMFVMDAIADDYEEIQKILEEVTSLGMRCGLTIGRDEIIQALVTLINRQLAKAFRLSPVKPVEEIEGVPPLDDIEEYYFWLTPTGRQLQNTRLEGWPFDEKGFLRRDWIAP